MRFRFVGVILALSVATAVGASALAQTGREPRSVLIIDVKGTIGVGTAAEIDEGLVRARTERAGLVVLRMDTPGGLVSSTRDIINGILASPVPVAVYVAPSGARAASAGTYLAYAAHVAAMAPGTHLGAATPIQLGMPGEPSPTNKSDKNSAMERKIVNDAVAYLQSLAQLRGRNAEWAAQAVRDAATLTAEDAEREKVVDLVAPSMADLLDRLDGRTLHTSEGELVLATRHAPVFELPPTWKVRMLAVITDPNIAFLLLMIGTYGIIFEFWSPGHVAPGVVGAICLLVGLSALSVLPLSFAGAALLLLGALLMAAEAFIMPGFGVLGLGGVAAFALGGLMLFDPSGADIDFSVAWPLVLAAAGTNAVLIVGLLGMIVRVRRRRPVTGAEEMIGLEGEVLAWQNDAGRIRIHGEIWSARGAGPFAAGSRVCVASRDGLVLTVRSAREGG